MRLFVTAADMPESCTLCPFAGEDHSCILRDRLSTEITYDDSCPLTELPGGVSVTGGRVTSISKEDLCRGRWVDHTPIAMLGVSLKHMPIYKKRVFVTVADLFTDKPVYELGPANLSRMKDCLDLPPLEMVSVDDALALVYRSVPAERYEGVKALVLRLPAFAPSQFDTRDGASDDLAVVLGTFRSVVVDSGAILDNVRFEAGLEALSTWQLGIPVYLRALAEFVLPEYAKLTLNEGDAIWLNGYTRDGKMKCSVRSKVVKGDFVSYIVSSNVGSHQIYPWDFGKTAFLSYEDALLGMEQRLHSLYPRVSSMDACPIMDLPLPISALLKMRNMGISCVDDLSFWGLARLQQEGWFTSAFYEDLMLSLAILDLKHTGEAGIHSRACMRYIK